jgi:molybdate transport system ATP-binding protein
MMPLTIDVQLTQGDFVLDVRERFQARAVALFGPSGSGKTTLIETMAGLRRPRSGRLAIGEHVLFDAAHGLDVPPRQRRIGYVPQDLALFPHLDVRRNVLFGASRGGAGAASDGLTLGRVLDLLELRPLLARMPGGLSGGERQRVALARALLSGPDLLLLDEPLAALHVSLRERILDDLRRVRDELGIPLLYVSHDAAEVRAIADWVLVLDGGRSVQSGPPADTLPGMNAAG